MKARCTLLQAAWYQLQNLSEEEFRWLIRILQNQRKWERLSARGKTVKKTAVAWLGCLPCSSGSCCGYYFIRFLNIRR